MYVICCVGKREHSIFERHSPSVLSLADAAMVSQADKVINHE